MMNSNVIKQYNPKKNGIYIIVNQLYAHFSFTIVVRCTKKIAGHHYGRIYIVVTGFTVRENKILYNIVILYDFNTIQS